MAFVVVAFCAVVVVVAFVFVVILSLALRLFQVKLCLMFLLYIALSKAGKTLGFYGGSLPVGLHWISQTKIHLKCVVIHLLYYIL